MARSRSRHRRLPRSSCRRPSPSTALGSGAPAGMSTSRSRTDTPDLDRRITEAAEGWRAERLGAVERNILRIALHELDGEEVPDEVAIDEAVTLAKRYATEDAARLVNGILGRIVREKAAR